MTSDDVAGADRHKSGGRAAKGGAAGQGKDRDMGAALRSAYQETVEEAIPSDLLDLLGKLD